MSVQVRCWTEPDGGSQSNRVGRLDIVHCASGLFTARFIAASRAELVFGFGVFARLIHSFFTGVLGDVFCT